MGDSRAERVLGQLHHWLGSRSVRTDDGRLLERFVRQRDEAAFAELVARHGPLVYGLCRRLLGHVQDAEDVFQATFLVLARKAAAIRKPQSLSCWLHGVAYRLSLKARAETERRSSREQQIQPLGATEDIDLSWREVRGLLDEELQRLPEKQRLPLVLCYLEGLTQDEAARRLGWPRGTLKRRLEAGRERLRLRLTRRGVTLGAGLFAAALTDSAAKGTVSATLRSATVQAGMQFVTHEAAALAVSPAALLAKGALQSMLMAKLKICVVVVLLFGCAVTAAGLAISPAPPEQQPKTKAEAPSTSRPAEQKQVRKDRYGDPLPPSAIARLGTLRLRHEEDVNSVVFSGDGKTAIACDSAGFIVYWDVATGREIRRLQKMPKAVEALAITRDGSTLASTAAGNLFLWEATSGKLLSQARLDDDNVVQMLFTPDGKTLVVNGWGKNIIYLWDTVHNKKRYDLKGLKGNVSSIAISPDGKTLAWGILEPPSIHLWDIASGKEKIHFTVDGTQVWELSYASDGKTLVSFGNGGLIFSDPNTGKLLRRIRWQFSGMGRIVYAPDGKTLVGIHGRSTIHILDVTTGKQLRKFDAPRRDTSHLAFSPDSKTLATWGNGSRAFDLWDVASGKLLHPAPGHRNYITSVVFSADGQQVFSSAGGVDFPVQVWDAQTGERREELGEGFKIPSRLALSPDGKLLAGGGYMDQAIRLWDLARRKEAPRCIGHKVARRSAHIIDTRIDWSADGKTLVSGSCDDKTIRLWDVATGKQLRRIDIEREWPFPTVLSPDGKIVAAGTSPDGTIRLWSAETGKELRSITTPQQDILTLAFSPDGSMLASGGYSAAIHLWEPATGRLLQQWDTKTSWTSELAFTRDGRTLVSGHDDGSVRLWHVATGKEIACFRGHRRGVRTVAISCDGRYVASGGEDTTVLVWDATGGARPDAALSVQQLRSLWEDLNTSEAGRAYRARWQLALSPKDALPFLVERLRPVAPLNAVQQRLVDRLLADLDSDRFAVRQQAEAELEKWGPIIEPALHKALASKPSLEVRQRIEKVLANLASERLRIQLALEAIEHMNTPEARRLVDSLANGAPRAWLTEEAAAIRKRWER